MDILLTLMVFKHVNAKKVMRQLLLKTMLGQCVLLIKLLKELNILTQELVLFLVMIVY